MFSNKCWNCFEVFFWKKILPSARWRVETWKKVRKMEKLSFFFKKPKYISKKVQKRFEHALRLFFWLKNWPVHPGGSKLGKIRKKIGKNLKFQKCPKTVLKVSKQILNLFWGNFLRKNCPVHPGRSKLGKTSKKLENFHFFKMPKYVPKSDQTCFQHASRYFFR